MTSLTLRATMESIDFQKSTLLFKELTMHVQTLFDLTADNGDIKETVSNIEKVIERHTGIKINLIVTNSKYYDAYVRMPQMDKNHPLWTDFKRQYASSDNLVSLIRSTGSILKGKVDRATSKVSGVFTELTSNVVMTDAFLYQGPGAQVKLTAGEVASAILHEVGHIFTFFEYLGSGITTNYILQYVSREVLGTNEKIRKFEILEEGSKLLGVEIEDAEALVRTTEESVIQTVLLKGVIEKVKSELGSTTYDMTSSEMLADQFVSRHGGGKDLVGAIYKMQRKFNPRSVYFSTHMAIEAMEVIMTIGGLFAPILLLFQVEYLTKNEDKSIYDKPKARLERVKRDMVQILKSSDIKDEEKKKFVEDIEAIDELIADMKDRASLAQVISRFLITSRRKDFNQIAFQQELEQMAHNDLFVKAAKFKN